MAESIGEYLAARGCTKAISLTGPGNRLAKHTSAWDPSVRLEGGEGFAPTFEKRYGIAFADRRGPVEAETLSGVYEAVRAAIESAPSALDLPARYRLSEQDKTDLFYVAGLRGGLAIREILEPLLVAPEPAEPPVSPAPPEPGPTPFKLLSVEAQETVRAIATHKWRGDFKAGRSQLIRDLAEELLALEGEKV